MITLGTHDREVPQATLAEYVALANRLTGVPEWTKLRGEREGQWLDFRPPAPEDMKVRELQVFLKEAGFLPEGRVDGICGYRTMAAIRLFQEYIRTVEGDVAIGSPDGLFGQKSMGHVRRWQQAGQRADWTRFGGVDPSPEYALWMDLLHAVQRRKVEVPGRIDGMMDQAPASDTVQGSDWDLDPARIHLIGIRRNEPPPGAQPYDDLFVLLIRGIVLKFLGSTDPGHTSNPRGFPFLIPGQHVYRFGWHKLSDQNRVYHALKPAGRGVLVVRSPGRAFGGADLAAGLERNNSINVHWGGEGTSGVVGRWSEGCQVLTGKGYVNHNGDTIDCTSFAATFYPQLGTKVNGVYQTKGAYTVLTDLVAALSGATDNTVRYMLLDAADLDLKPELADVEATAKRELQAIG